MDSFLNSTQALYQIRSSGMSVTRQYDFIPFFTAEINANELQMLTMHPDVTSIGPGKQAVSE